jgi:two-component system LytT family response regulator
MIRAIILEDEEDSRKLLISFLKDYCSQINILAAVDTVQKGLEAIQTYHPDVVFMDIELKGENSFDLLDKLGDIQFDIIFTTAYDSYMLKAIRLSAVDYLLKPINVQELKEAVEKVQKKHDQIKVNKSLQALLDNFKTNYHDHQIAISSSDGFVFVKVGNIIYLKSDGAYTYFYLKQDQKIITSKNIKEYEELLADHNFFRIHKSYIVNMAEVVKYIRGEGGSVVMSNNAVFDVSRRRKDEFLKLLDKA